MPLVIDPDASRCDVCLDNYDPSSDVTPVVLACGHTLCKPCSKSLGTNCHLCRSFFSRDRVVKLHVDYGFDKSPTAEVAKLMEIRAAKVSSLTEFSFVRDEIEQIVDWLEQQPTEKYMLLRSYCELVLKLCLTMEAKMDYKARYRSVESKLRDCTEDSEARVHDLKERLNGLENELSLYRKSYANDLDDDLMSIRNGNPLPQPPQPIFYGSPPSRTVDLDYGYTQPKSRSRGNETSSHQQKPVRSPTRGHSTKSRKRHTPSGSSSRQRSDTEAPQAPRPTQRRSHEHSRPHEEDDRYRHHVSSNRHYDPLGQDPQRFSRSYSHDNIVEYSHAPSERPKPRSSSHGQTGVTYPSGVHPGSGSRRSSNEHTQRLEAEAVEQQHQHTSSSIHFPSANTDNVEAMPGDSLTMRSKKLSNASINSTIGHRTIAGHRAPSTSRSSHQHQQPLHPVNTHSYAPIPSNEQLGPRSRKSSLQNSNNVAPSNSSHAGTSNGRPLTVHANIYPSATSATVAQPSSSPNTASFSSAAKPLPPKPEYGASMPFPEPQIQTQSQASGSGSTRFHVTPGPATLPRAAGPINVPIDPNTIPQEDITVISSRTSKKTQSRPPIPTAMAGKRSASGGTSTSRGNSPSAHSSYGSNSNSFHQYSHRHSMSNPNLHAQTYSHSQTSSQTSSGRHHHHERSRSSSRNPDNVVYPRYADSAVSDTATTVMSTRTPRLRRTSGTRLLSGTNGASRPTTPGFVTDGAEL